MLYRIAGKVNDAAMPDGKPFTARIEAPTIVGAVSTARLALNSGGVPDEGILELRARAVKGGTSIRFGKPADPNAPKRPRKAKAAVAGNVAGAASKK